jgi:hypothetical protein
MGTTTFSGPVNSVAGFVGTVTGDVTGNVTGDVTGNVTGDVVGAIQLPSFDFDDVPSAIDAGAGTLIFVSDGAEGNPVVAFSDGTDWLRVDTRVAISDS